MTIKNIGHIEIGGASLTVLEGELKSCGNCKACCTAIGVVELSKRNYQRCRHLCKKGCSIQESKPESCGEYQCWYTQGIVQDRPDKIGLLVDYKPIPAPGVIRVWEVKKGAAKKRRGKRFISKLLHYDSEIAVIDQKQTKFLRSGQIIPTPKEVQVDPVDELEREDAIRAVSEFAKRLKSEPEAEEN